MAYTEYNISRDDSYSASTFNTSNSYIYIGGVDGGYVAALSFNISGIPKAAIINAAYIQYTANALSVGKSSPAKVKYYTCLDDITSWPGYNRSAFDAVTKSTPETEDINTSWVTGTTYDSIDISATIQAAVDLFDYIGGRKFLIAIDANTSISTSHVRAFDAGSATRPKLFIDWSFPDPYEDIETYTTDKAQAYGVSSYQLRSGTNATQGNYYGDVFSTLAKFPSVGIPNSATIESAVLKITYESMGILDESPSVTVKISIKGVLYSNASLPTDRAGYDALTFTASNVLQEFDSPFTSDIIVTTADISDVISEITSLAGWTAWNSIVISFEDDTTVDNPAFFTYKTITLDLTWSAAVPGRIVSYGTLLTMSQAIVEGGRSLGLLAEMSQAILAASRRSAGFKVEGAMALTSTISTGAFLQGASLLIPSAREHGMSLSLSGWIEASARQSGMLGNIVLPPGFAFNPLGRNAGFVAKGASELSMGRSHGMSVAVEMSTFATLSVTGATGISLSGAMALVSGLSAGLKMTGFKNNVLIITSGRKHGFKVAGNHINGYLVVSGRLHGFEVLANTLRFGNLTAGIRAGMELENIENGLGFILSGARHGLLLSGEIERTGYLTAGLQIGQRLEIIPAGLITPDSPLIESTLLLLQHRREFVA